MSLTRKLNKSKDKPTGPGIDIELREAYICRTCRHVTLCVCIHNGNLPSIIPCERCQAPSTSFMGVLPPVLSLPEGFQGLPATKELYDATHSTDELTKAEQDHVDRGVLAIRDRTDAEPLTKFLKTG